MYLSQRDGNSSNGVHVHRSYENHNIKKLQCFDGESVIRLPVIISENGVKAEEVNKTKPGNHKYSSES